MTSSWISWVRRGPSNIAVVSLWVWFGAFDLQSMFLFNARLTFKAQQWVKVGGNEGDLLQGDLVVLWWGESHAIDDDDKC